MLCQHLPRAAANVSLHTILLGVGGTICSPYSLVPSFGRYSLETLPYLIVWCLEKCRSRFSESHQACCKTLCSSGSMCP